GIAERQRALPVDEPDLRMLLRDLLELAQEPARLLAVERRGGPRDADLRAQLRAALLLRRLLEQRERLPRLVIAQVRVSEIHAMPRVLLRERRRPMREIRL